MKAAVTKMVQEAYTYVDLTQDMPVKMKLIETLRTVTEGMKIFTSLYKFFYYYFSNCT